MGYIDTKGRIIHDLVFELANDFSEGLAAVKVDGKWGYIANPLVYDTWSPDELTRADSLGIGFGEDVSETVTTQDFIRLLQETFTAVNFENAEDYGDAELTRGVASELISEIAKQYEMYTPYLIPECDDEQAITEERRFAIGFAIQSGTIKLQDGAFGENDTLSRNETLELTLRLYEFILHSEVHTW